MFVGESGFWATSELWFWWLGEVVWRLRNAYGNGQSLQKLESEIGIDF